MPWSSNKWVKSSRRNVILSCEQLYVCVIVQGSFKLLCMKRAPCWKSYLHVYRFGPCCLCVSRAASWHRTYFWWWRTPKCSDSLSPSGRKCYRRERLHTPWPAYRLARQSNSCLLRHAVSKAYLMRFIRSIQALQEWASARVFAADLWGKAKVCRATWFCSEFCHQMFCQAGLYLTVADHVLANICLTATAKTLVLLWGSLQAVHASCSLVIASHMADRYLHTGIVYAPLSIKCMEIIKGSSCQHFGRGAYT